MMIKINRSACPQALKDGRNYNHKDVVEALWKMQHGKCCYCEHDIPNEGHQKAVDHFEPQSIFKRKVNDWNNLLLACSQCNGKKSDKFPVLLTNNENESKVLYIKEEYNGEPMIINPTVIDAENHIGFILDDSLDEEEELIWGLISGKDELGEITVKVIGLARKYYTIENRKHLRKVLIRDFYDLLEALEKNDTKMIMRIKRNFETSMSANREHAALTRAFAKYKKLDRFGIRILKEAETA